MENNLFKRQFEEKEKEPVAPDLKVDFIRHGKPEYTEEEITSAQFEGKLTPEGEEQIKKTAEDLAAKINKNKELIVVWTSPKNRAKQSAAIIGKVLQEKGVAVIKGADGARAKDSLGDVKVSKDFIREIVADNVDFGDWMEYWAGRDDLPEGTENAEDVKKRVERVMAYLDRIARKVNPKDGKTLRFICVGHEEIVRDLLEDGFGLGTKKGEGPDYSEVVSIGIKKSEKDKPAVLKMSYRGQEAKLEFDKNKGVFSRPSL